MPDLNDMRGPLDDMFNEEENEMDIDLETFLEKIRALQEKNDTIHSLDEVVSFVLTKKNSRAKRNVEEEEVLAAENRSNDDVVSGLVKTLSERSQLSSNSQTVGSLLATIPGILQSQGVKFDSISNHIVNFEKSIENVIESGFSKIAEQVKQAGDRIGKSGEKNSEILSDIGDFLHQDIDSLKQTIGDNGETLHQGLDSIVEKMEYSANVEETLHDGFHSIAEKLVEDKSKLDDTIHDGLHEISEKIDSVNSYGLTGIINSLESHGYSKLPIVHGNNKGLGYECKFIKMQTIYLFHFFRWNWTPFLSV